MNARSNKLCFVLAVAALSALRVHAQEHLPAPAVDRLAAVTAKTAALAASDTPLPINLPTALKLANVQPIDISVAFERIRVAEAELKRARVLWLPTVYLGVDYYRHDGQLQDVAGEVFSTSKQSLMVGAGPYAVFAVADALFRPLAARQELHGRHASLQTAMNDTMLDVAVAYFDVQQARGELAGAEEVSRRADDLLKRTQQLAAGLVPELEVVRTRTQAAGIRQGIQTARERWRVSSANLTRVLRLDSSAVVDPIEAPHLRITLIAPDKHLDELIQIGLTHRPELANRQALVQATLVRLRQEKLRPLVPSVLLRGASTQPGGTLGAGVFGGGRNDDMSNFRARSDFDVQVLWELQNLGFGNHALVEQRRAENQLAVLELFRTQDRIAAEVAQAHAQVRSATERLADAEEQLADAVDSADKNLTGLGQTKSAGNILILIVRPQEVVASIQTLSQAYGDYYRAIADYDRAQFRLYRALGHPADAVPVCTSENGSEPLPAIRLGEAIAEP